jgi:ABC-2 type transport system permease protein
MRCVPTLLRRELNAYFASVVGYIVGVIFLLIIGLIFCLGVAQLMKMGVTQVTVMQAFFYWFWLPALFVVPAITMRLLAEEKRSGSIEMLMTAPVSEFEVVLAKWLGAVVLYVMMWAVTALYVVILNAFTFSGAKLDYGPILAGYLGVLVIGQFLISLGVLGSALTKNQVAAFLITFVALFFIIIGTLFASYMLKEMPIGKVAEAISVLDHMQDFARGVVDVRPLVFYASGTVLALFVTTRVLESRKWR